MTCTPSPRPFWSVWPTNSILRAETGIMLRFLSSMSTSFRWRGDFVEREASRFGPDTGDGYRGDRDHDRQRRKNGIESEADIDPQDRRDRHRGADPACGLRETETGGTRGGRKDLGNEDL